MTRESLYVEVYDVLQSNLRGKVRFDRNIKFTPKEIDRFGQACDIVETNNGTWHILNGSAPDVRRMDIHFTNETMLKVRENDVLVTGYYYERIDQ